MVADHGGTIKAHSAGLVGGSQFVLTLPTVAAPAGVPNGRPPDRAPEINGSPRLLLVDDNADSVLAMAELLRMHGYDCTVAGDVLLGLAAARDDSPEVAIIDIGLPGLDGFGLAAELRKLYGPAMTLIAMSGYSSVETQTRAAQSGFDHFMVKPVDTSEVLKRLPELTKE